jgi:hypothetical protein
MGWT